MPEPGRFGRGGRRGDISLVVAAEGSDGGGGFVWGMGEEKEGPACLCRGTGSTSPWSAATKASDGGEASGMSVKELEMAFQPTMDT